MEFMKLQKYEALEKHLLEAHPDHLSSLYLIASPREAERKFLVGEIAESIRGKRMPCILKRAEELQKALDFIAAPSLFGENLVATAEIGKDQSALLVAYARAPMRGTHLVLGIENGKQAAELYQLTMRELLLLDLSAETPWDRRNRLKQWALQKMGKENKKMSPALVEALIERTDLDLGVLEQELEKLFCYVGDRSEIQKEDLEAICTSSSTQVNGFKLAELLIEGSFKPPYRVRDLSELLPLIGQIRYLFEVGLKLTSQLEKGERPVDKNLALVKKRNSAFFINGLSALFQLELSAKRSLGSPQLLFDYFCCKL